MINVANTLKENSRKNIIKPYNQITGEGCLGDRVRLEIKDAPYPVLYLPVEMKDLPVVKDLRRYKSIKKIYQANGEELTEREFDLFWISLCELRIKHDYEYYAITYQTIKDKETGNEMPFRLNRAQRRILVKLENQRRAGKPIYIIVLKARQMGGSTVIQMYMNWIQMVHRRNWNSVIAAHLKGAAITVRSMYDECINKMPVLFNKVMSIKNFDKADSIKHVPQRGCRITIGSAQEPESVRSQDLKMFHGSEVAFYPDTPKMSTAALIASISSSVPNVPYAMSAYESTANGVGDFFHTQWLAAVKGETAFVPIFNPWFVLDIYRIEFNGAYHPLKGRDEVEGTIMDFVASMDEYEINLFNNTECTLEALNWRRMKRKTAASESTFKQEFPSYAEEAFQTTGKPVFNAEDIDAMRYTCCAPETMGIIISRISPAEAIINTATRGGVLDDIKFVDYGPDDTLDPTTRKRNERNKIKIWVMPDYQKIPHRYLVIYDPSKGKTESADNGVITVYDRFWKMYGGKMEVVAEMIIREDKDIAIWKAAQIAKWYNNALLVVESNTFESTDRHEDTEFILDTIGKHYTNLYSRTPAEKVKEGVPAVFGFHMNKSTKPMTVATYTAYLREQAYTERNEDALDEARLYEKKENGTLGAVEGHNDDRLATRMIGCQIDTEMPLPYIVEEREKKMTRTTKNESSF